VLDISWVSVGALHPTAMTSAETPPSLNDNNGFIRILLLENLFLATGLAR
jgi:hypothetical protein